MVRNGPPTRLPASSYAAIRHSIACRTSAVLVAVGLISVANSLQYGEFTLSGVLLVSVALPIMVWSLYAGLAEPSLSFVAAVIGVVLAANYAPGLIPSYAEGQYPLLPLLSTLAASTIAMLAQARWSRYIGLAGAVATTLLLYRDNTKWGHATIDVFYVLQGGTLALLHGHNPYIRWYQSTTPHELHTHFPYGSAALLLALPGRLIGDVRLSELAAMAIAIVATTLIARRNLPSHQAWWILALLLTVPFTVHMVAQAWVEVFGAAGVALWLLMRERHRRSAIFALGAGVSASFLVLPLLVFAFVWHRQLRRDICAAVLVAVALAIPFVYWTGLVPYVRDVFLVPLSLPWRPDAMNINALWGQVHGSPLPPEVMIGLPVTVFACLVARGKSGVGTCVAMGASVTLAALLVAKDAFFNYYFLVVFALILALALGYGQPAAQARRACSGVD